MQYDEIKFDGMEEETKEGQVMDPDASSEVSEEDNSDSNEGVVETPADSEESEGSVETPAEESTEDSTDEAEEMPASNEEESSNEEVQQ